jgi:acetylornithine deacetylase
MSLDSVETLQQLVRIPSVNPMGRDVTGPIYGERRLTEYLQNLCERVGWRWLRQPVHRERENLVAIVPGFPPAADGGELLLWDVHQDTVGVDGMAIDPFAGELRNGCLFGRGACDVKGTMAAMLAALSRLESVLPDRRRPTIVVAFTANEECGFTGASALCDLWKPDNSHELGACHGTISARELFPRPPDAAIVAEPTELNVVVAHQGVVRWRCRAEGRAAHSSRPQQGVNAIYAIAKVVAAIEQYSERLATSAIEHPLCGRPTVCVSTIHGGIGVNTVPDQATIEIDRRLSPGEDAAAAYDDLVRFVAERVERGEGREGARLVHEPPFMQSRGLADEVNRPIAKQLSGIVHDLRRESQLLGVPYGTDAAAISANGVPAVVFGPGSIDQAHTSDEYIAVGQLELAADIFLRIASVGLG